MALPHPLKSFDCLVAVEGFFLRFEVDGFDLFFVVAFENFSRARDNGSIQSIVCVKIHIVTLRLAQISAAHARRLTMNKTKADKHLILCKALFRLQDKEEKL